MKIYRVIVNQVSSEPMVILGSYNAQRTLKTEEFFATRDKAEARHKEIYDSAQKLLGFIPNIEAVIHEITVQE